MNFANKPLLVVMPSPFYHQPPPYVLPPPRGNRRVCVSVRVSHWECAFLGTVESSVRQIRSAEDRSTPQWESGSARGRVTKKAYSAEPPISTRPKHPQTLFHPETALLERTLPALSPSSSPPRSPLLIPSTPHPSRQRDSLARCCSRARRPTHSTTLILVATVVWWTEYYLLVLYVPKARYVWPPLNISLEKHLQAQFSQLWDSKGTVCIWVALQAPSRPETRWPPSSHWLTAVASSAIGSQMAIVCCV